MGYSIGGQGPCCRAPLITSGLWVAASITAQAGLPVALLPNVIIQGNGDLGGIWQV